MTKVAFVGLGRMGGPMALNMARKGFDLAVYDVNPAAMAAFTEFNNCRQAADANDAARDAEIAITVLPGPPQLESVVIAEGGMIDALPDGALLMDLSTVLPETTDRMAARAKATGRRFVDAPIGRLASHADAARASSWSAPSPTISRRSAPRWKRWAPRSSIAADRAPAPAPSS